MSNARMLLLAATLAATFAVAGTATAHHRARNAGSSTIELHMTSLGNVVADSSGFTLFEFTRDRARVDNCQSIKECTEIWPPLVVRGKPTAGAGLNPKLLSTIKLKNGSHQVTYAGHPLYHYTGDAQPGETGYVGVSEFGGRWFAVNAKGGAVK
jgi:predicted lipoprotein with Yx(FWY)xxD motif